MLYNGTVVTKERLKKGNVRLDSRAASSQTNGRQQERHTGT